MRFRSGPGPVSGPTQRTRRFGRRSPWLRDGLLRAAESSPWLTGRQCPSIRVSSPVAHGPSVPLNPSLFPSGSRAVSGHHAPTVSSPAPSESVPPSTQAVSSPMTEGPRSGLATPESRSAREPSRPYVARVRVRVRDVRRRWAYGESGTRPDPAAAVLRPSLARPSPGRDRAERTATPARSSRLIRSRPRPVPPPLGATCTGHREEKERESAE